MTKKPIVVDDELLPESYYDTFHGRDQEEMDELALDDDLLPSNPSGEPMPEPKSSSVSCASLGHTVRASGASRDEWGLRATLHQVKVNDGRNPKE